MRPSKPKKEEVFYAVEHVRKHRRRRKKLEFLIKWKGYPESSNSWEPSNFVTTLAKQEYLKKVGKPTLKSLK